MMSPKRLHQGIYHGRAKQQEVIVIYDDRDCIVIDDSSDDDDEVEIVTREVAQQPRAGISNASSPKCDSVGRSKVSRQPAAHPPASAYFNKAPGDDNSLPELPEPRLAQYSFEEFVENWELVEEDMGLTIEKIEESRAIRSANSKMQASDSATQGRAQYGRLLFEATDLLFEQLELNSTTDVFLDIGHGIGNTVLQAAYTRQCHARGIEVVNDRHASAVAYAVKLEELRQIHKERDSMLYEVGEIEWVHGSLEESEHRTFLTTPPPGKVFIKAFCNNFHGAFKDRSVKGRDTMLYLDNYNAGLFAMMPPGSILITTDKLILPPPRNKVHDHQSKVGVTTKSPDASFFQVEEIDLCTANDAVTWTSASNQSMLRVYKYTRLAQESKTAVFQCWNRHCDLFCQVIDAQQTVRGTTGIIARASCYRCNRTDGGLRSNSQKKRKMWC